MAIIKELITLLETQQKTIAEDLAALYRVHNLLYEDSPYRYNKLNGPEIVEELKHGNFSSNLEALAAISPEKAEEVLGLIVKSKETE